jgi:hypothetical protein
MDLAAYLIAGGNYSVSAATKSSYNIYGNYSAPVSFAAISNASEFNAVSSAPGGRYLLIADIDLGGESKYNFITGTFSGLFDGNGKKIYNFSISSGWNNGLFTDISGTVRNLSVICNTFNVGHQGGLLAYRAISSSVIDNVYVYAGEIVHNGSGQANGLIAAYNNAGNIRNCVVSGNWSSASVNTNLGNLRYIATQQSSGAYSNNTVIINNAPAGLNETGVTNKITAAVSDINMTAGADASISGISAGDGYTLSYASGNSAVITVDASGNLHAVAAGTTYIEITLVGITAGGTDAKLLIKATVS